MRQGLIIAIILIIIGALGWYFFVSPRFVQAPELEPVEEPILEIPSESEQPAPLRAAVLYTDAGFVPATITVKKGTIVTFINQTANEDMWIGSDEHPTHSQYDGTNKDDHCPDTTGTVFDQCQEGERFSFTFQKVGTWHYHNHRDDDIRGTVIVTE